MRIGIEAQRIFRKKKHGMDFVALELIKNLPHDNQHEYVVFCNAKPQDIDPSVNPHVTFVAKSGAYPVWEQYWLPKMAKSVEIEVLHCTANTFPIRCSVPIVLTLHDIIFMEGNPLYKRGYTLYQRFGNYYRRLLVKSSLKKIKATVTVSNFEKTNIQEKLKPAELKVIYNGVGNHFFSQKRTIDSIKEKYQLPENYILFLGNTDPKKNTPNTLNAFVEFAESVPAAQLVIGDLDERYIKSIIGSSAFDKLANRIHAIGYIDNQDLPAILNHAEVFLYPSLRESFGIPLLEGMASGVPVITSNTSSLPEIANNAALEVDPYSSSNITNALLRIWKNDDLRESMIKAGCERAKSFSWQKMAKAYVNVYESLAL